MKLIYSCLCIFFISVIVSCKKPYNPAVITSKSNFMVVEGFISINDTTTVKLSRTVSISSKSSVNPVTGASITVEDDQNGSFALAEAPGGRYKLGGISFDASHKYRFRIKTTDHKEYLSDFVQPMITPPIDSVGYSINNNNAQIYVNTHNSLSGTRYYRWDYGETWIIHTKFISLFKATKGDRKRVGYRSLSEEINRCWSSDTSSSITLGTSEKLTQNIIANQTIISIPLSSEKFTERYSILINQYAVSKDAYTYYDKLKKNTEDLGSIFDAQPSQLISNIHCISNPGESVIGFITAGSVMHKRIFVDPANLPHAILELPYSGCIADSLLFTDAYFTKFFYTDEIPVSAITDPIFKNDTLGYTGSSGVCVDCTLRGTNKQPAFWK